ncbi:MAG: 4'-phosphopantetheinyl transferase superfamily protein [Planctomycetes bacterium]|nr:4'-phosphopantetheinyl transferase superfamily protein [Planctomycetota bacterium]
MNSPRNWTPYWHDLPSAAPLRRGEVHAWLLDLDTTAPLDESLLDANERERAARLKLPSDRRHFVRRRVLARQLLASMLGVSPTGIVWKASPRGRLSLDSAALDFNWSRSGNLFLFAATADGRVGVDIERWRDDIDPLALAESALPSADADRLRSLPVPSRSSTFWTAWTAQEATAKALGTGIAEPLAANSPSCRIAHRTVHHKWSAAVAWLWHE